jgi:hypothetical protein
MLDRGLRSGRAAPSVPTPPKALPREVTRREIAPPGAAREPTRSDSASKGGAGVTGFGIPSAQILPLVGFLWPSGSALESVPRRPLGKRASSATPALLGSCSRLSFVRPPGVEGHSNRSVPASALFEVFTFGVCGLPFRPTCGVV